jgi:exodeoxyribonuclease V alpha subunit
VNELLNEVTAVAIERNKLARQANAKEALGKEFADNASVLNQQILCVHHRGKLGVQSINQRIRQSLGARAQKHWFVGRPVLITRNDFRTELYNGDTGVIADINGEQVLALSDAPDRKKPLELKLIEVSRVTDHALNYAMTVHKSQGSEYRHVIVMFPQKPSRICTREMLYTAISRVRDRLTIVGSEDVIRHMLETPIRRASGLADRF